MNRRASVDRHERIAKTQGERNVARGFRPRQSGERFERFARSFEVLVEEKDPFERIVRQIAFRKLVDDFRVRRRGGIDLTHIEKQLTDQKTRALPDRFRAGRAR